MSKASTAHAADEGYRLPAEDQFAGLPLLAAAPAKDPPWLVAPLSPIEHAFQEFHARHPEIYRALEEEALRRVTAGERRLAIARLVEELRYDRRFQHDADHDAFKVNNNFRALYARLLIHRHPALADVFALRDRHEQATGDGS